MSRDVHQDFFLAGLKHYPDAWATVQQFRRDVRTQLGERLRDYPWTHWKRGADSGPKPTESTTSGLWLGAYLGGALAHSERSAGIELGIWWKPTRFPGEECVLCATFIDAPEELRSARPSLPLPANVHHTESGARSYFWTRLSLDDADLDDATRKVLEAFDAAIGQADR